MGHNTTREKVRIAQRHREVVARYFRGERQYEIAAALGMSTGQISTDLKVIRQAWLAEAVDTFDVLKSRELARIDALEQEAWCAWERSKAVREISITEATEGGERQTRKASVRKEDQVGDPRFLTEIGKCIDRRCALLQLLPPQRVAPTTPDGKESWEPTVIYLPSKAPSAEVWAREVQQMLASQLPTEQDPN